MCTSGTAERRRMMNISDVPIWQVLSPGAAGLVCSKCPSQPIPGKTTASPLPQSRLRETQRNFCAHATHQHRRNEWAHRPSLPSQTLRPPCSDSSAGVRRAVRDIRLQHLAAQNYCGLSSFLFCNHTGASREVHAPFCVRLEVQSLRPTRPGYN